MYTVQAPKHKSLLRVRAVLFRKFRIGEVRVASVFRAHQVDITMTGLVYLQSLLDLWSLDCCFVLAENI